VSAHIRMNGAGDFIELSMRLPVADGVQHIRWLARTSVVDDSVWALVDVNPWASLRSERWRVVHIPTGALVFGFAPDHRDLAIELLNWLRDIWPDWCEDLELHDAPSRAQLDEVMPSVRSWLEVRGLLC